MKFLLSLITLLAIALPTVALGQANPAPYNPVLKHLIEDQRSSGQHLKRFARATWNFGVHGGGSTADIGLGVFLPAKAIITRSYLEVVTQQTSAGAATTQVYCEDANNIKTATDITGSAAGAFVEGQSTGAASAFKNAIASKCEIKVRFGVFPVTAGKFNTYVEYVVGD